MTREHRNMLGDLQAENDQRNPEFMSTEERIRRLESLVKHLQIELVKTARKAEYAASTAGTLANGGKF